MKRWFIIGGAVIVAFCAGYGGVRVWRHYEANRTTNVPVEENVAITNEPVANIPTTNTNTNTAPAKPAALPKEINLAAPFTSQAPTANWDAEHEEFCEEASILMAVRALTGRTIKDAAEAEAAMQAIKTWEIARFGYFESTTADETATIVTDYFHRQARLIVDPTVAQLKAELAADHFIVVPANGRDLHNPNFKQPGPIYHMLLLKGYLANGNFITNDPGTRRGKNYVYTADVLMDAIHDWNGGDVPNGRRVVIVVS